jgi:hypothetical protein
MESAHPAVELAVSAAGVCRGPAGPAGGNNMEQEDHAEIIIVGGTSGSVGLSPRTTSPARSPRTSRSKAPPTTDVVARPQGRVRGLAADLSRPQTLADALADVERWAGSSWPVFVATTTPSPTTTWPAAELATVKVVGYTTAVHHPGLVADSPAWAGNAAVLAANRRVSLSDRLATTADIVAGSAFLLDNRAANGVGLVLHGGRR